MNLCGSLHETGRGRADHVSEIWIGVHASHGLGPIKLRTPPTPGDEDDEATLLWMVKL